MANINQSWDFAFTGASQTFSAEANHVYYLEVNGASGGNGGGDGGGTSRDLGGFGGFAKGYYKNTTAGTWTIQVGGQGKNGGTTSGGAGGYYCGGKGGNDGDDAGVSESGGGGGGCTTIQQLLTGGGGSGGGSPNASVQGVNASGLHDGKGSGGAGGAGFKTTGGSGGLVNGGTAPKGGNSTTPAEAGKNYIGGVTNGTHGTLSARGNGSAKITCKAKTPSISYTSRDTTGITVTYNYNCDITGSKQVQVYINNAWTNVATSTAVGTSNATAKYTVPNNFNGTLKFRAYNGYFYSSEISVTYDKAAPVVSFPSNFATSKWYQGQVNTNMLTVTDTNISYVDWTTEIYVNGALHSTISNSTSKDITPPLIYSPIKPEWWTYQMYLRTRARQKANTPNGTTADLWSDWVTSPTVEVEYNVPPSDINFLPMHVKAFVQGQQATFRWNPATDKNGSKCTYNFALKEGTNTLYEQLNLSSTVVTVTIPKDILSNNITFNVLAYSDGLYSNPVTSPRIAITDVNVMDCTLDFPRLNTNVTGQFKELQLVINGDKRIVKQYNFVDYSIPMHYFKRGRNTVTLVAVDRNDVEVTRTWNVNLDFDKDKLVTPREENLKLEGYVSFNHNEQEQYVSCTTLSKSNLDLGLVEHELYGSTTFEGADTITQKLVITRDVNDDLTQLRTLKITGAIE